jgi:hypothetical protein
VNEREQLLMTAVTDRLRPLWNELVAEGWHLEVIVMAPEEIPRLPGFKIALIIPLDMIPPTRER